MSEIRSQAAPARDELAARDVDRFTLAELIHVNVCHRDLENCEGECDLTAKGAVTAGWSKPRTVNSAAELEALAEGSVILTGGVASIALTDLNQPVRVWDAGHGAQCTTDRLTFPATVLFTPGDAG
ncbi:hypothetical protein ACS7JX_19045 [Rhodococcus erythropolis]